MLSKGRLSYGLLPIACFCRAKAYLSPCTDPLNSTSSVIFKDRFVRITVCPMAYFPKATCSIRSPRTAFSTPEPAQFRVEDRMLKGRLQRLSLTGGYAVLDAAIRGGTLAEIAISTPLGPVCGLIEFFERDSKRIKRSELAFRFVGLNDVDYERLGHALRQFG